jgi:hypothetical protein
MRTVEITHVEHSQFENMQSLSCQKYITFSGFLQVGGIFIAALLLNLGFHNSVLTRLSLGFQEQIEFLKTFERINLFPQILMFLGL